MKNVDMIFEELGHIAYMVNENSNNTISSDLVYEAFYYVVNEKIGWLDRAKNAVGSMAGKVVKGATSAWNTATNVVNSGISAVEHGIDWAKKLPGKMYDKIKILGEKFVNWLTKDVADFFSKKWTAVKAAPGDLLQAIKDGAKWLYDNLIKPWSSKIEPLWNDTIKPWIMKHFVYPIIGTPVDVIPGDLGLIGNMEWNKQMLEGYMKDNWSDLQNWAKRQVKEDDSPLNKTLKFIANLPGDVASAIGIILKGTVVVVLVIGIIIWKIISAVWDAIVPPAFKMAQDVITYLFGTKDKKGIIAKYWEKAVTTINSVVDKVVATAKDVVDGTEFGKGYDTEMAKESRRNVMTYENFILRK